MTMFRAWNRTYYLRLLLHYEVSSVGMDLSSSFLNPSPMDRRSNEMCRSLIPYWMNILSSNPSSSSSSSFFFFFFSVNDLKGGFVNYRHAPDVSRNYENSPSSSETSLAHTQKIYPTYSWKVHSSRAYLLKIMPTGAPSWTDKWSISCLDEVFDTMPFCFRPAPTSKPPSFPCSLDIEHWILGASHGRTCSPLEALCLIEPQ